MSTCPCPAVELDGALRSDTADVRPATSLGLVSFVRSIVGPISNLDVARCRSSADPVACAAPQAPRLQCVPEQSLVPLVRRRRYEGKPLFLTSRARTRRYAFADASASTSYRAVCPGQGAGPSFGRDARRPIGDGSSRGSRQVANFGGRARGTYHGCSSVSQLNIQMCEPFYAGYIMESYTLDNIRAYVRR